MERDRGNGTGIPSAITVISRCFHSEADRLVKDISG